MVMKNLHSIQQKAIVPFTTKNDIIAQAQSGTGKTATFSIGMLKILMRMKIRCKSIVLAHTRELALQIKTVIDNLSNYMSNMRISLCVGGTLIRDNIDELNKNPQVIIGTPGRVLDMLNKHFINRKTIKMLILDESDELLSRIFVNQIYEIFRNLSNDIKDYLVLQ